MLFLFKNCGSVDQGAAGSHSLIQNGRSLFCLLFSSYWFVALSPSQFFHVTELLKMSSSGSSGTSSGGSSLSI